MPQAADQGEDTTGALSLTQDNILRAIKQHPAPLSKARLDDYFASRDWGKLLTILQKLIRAGEIEQTPRGYKAREPWGELSVAYVQEDREKGKRVPLGLENAPQDLPYTVSISDNQMRTLGLEKGNRVLIRIERTAKPDEMHAHVLDKLAPDQRPRLPGTFNINADGPCFRAKNKHLKRVFGATADSNLKLGDKALCSAELPEDHDIKRPQVRILQDQDRDMSTGEPISDIVARKYDINFGHSVLALQQAEKLKVRRIDRSFRADMTDLPIITIDPPGARDRDDGIFADIMPDGSGYKLYVAITDVAEIVPSGSEVDREAYEQGVSYYFPDKTAHMLPDTLSTAKCSLQKDHDRPVVMVEQDYSWNGDLLRYDIYPALAKAAANLSYGEAQDRIDRRDQAMDTLANLYRVQFESQRARRRSTKNMAGEVFQANDNHWRQSPSQQIVAHHMVTANTLIADYLMRHQIPTLYRNNGPTSSIHMYAQIVERLQKLGITMPDDPNNCGWQDLDHVVAQARDKGLERYVIPLVRDYLTDRAYYSPHNLGHFSLGVGQYVHGTSPIRRYPDLLVQRGLHKAWGTAYGLSEDEVRLMPEMARHLNARKQSEKDMARDRHKHHAIADLHRVDNQIVSAFVVDINEDDMEIILPGSGLSLRIGKDDLPGDIAYLDKAARKLVFHDRGSTLTSLGRGDKINGRITDIDETEGKWRFIVTLPRSCSPSCKDRQRDAGAMPS